MADQVLNGGAGHASVATISPRTSVELRPGVRIPDWAAVQSPAARDALDAIFGVSGQMERLRGIDGTVDRVWRTVLDIFAFTPNAPTVAAIAQLSSLDTSSVESALQDLRRRDLVVLGGSDGEVPGAYPFTRSPTAHRVRFGATERNAMCAIDALGVGAMCDTDARIASACHGCGRPIAVGTAGRGQRIESVTPPEARVFVGIAYDGTCMASSLCRVLAFFCSDTCLTGWRTGPGAGVPGSRLTVDEGLEVGKAIFGPLLRTGETALAGEGSR